MKNQINDNNLTKENYNLNELDLFFDNLIKNNSSLKNFLKIEDIKTFQPLIDIIKSELAIKYPSLISKKSNDTSLTKDDNESKKITNKENQKDEKKIKTEKENKIKEGLNKLEKINVYKFEYNDRSKYDNLKNEIEKLKEDLKNKENQYYIEIEKKEKIYILLNDKISIYKDEINNIKKEIEELKEILKNKENKIKQLNETLNNKKNELKNKENEIDKYKEELQNIEYNYNKIKEENYSINHEISELKLEINEKNFQNNELKIMFESEQEKNIVSLSLINEKEKEIKYFTNKFKLIEDIILSKEKIVNNKININLLNKKEEEQKVSNDDYNSNNYGKIGLINEELNCYMSSVIQILKNLKQFSFNILEIKIEDNIIESFQKLLRNLFYSKKKYISLYEFKRYFSNIYKRFEGKRNNDSTYFLIYFIQYIHKILNKPNNENITNINEFTNLGLINSEKIELQNFINKYESKNNSFIKDIFYGYQMNKIYCSGCNYCKNTFQSYNLLDIPLMDEKNKLKSLEQCLNCYLNIKDQKGIKGFDCAKCKKNLISLQTSIIKLPNVLIINLKRVGENSIYNHDIEIPFILKTKSIEKLNKFNQNYELIGFIKHYGNDESGHNIAYSKNIFDNKWYEFNDTIVKEQSEYPSTKKTFLLFYQLIKNERY